MTENNNKRLIELDKRSFAPVVAMLMVVLGSVLALVFSIMNANGTAESTLDIVAAAISVAGALLIAAVVVLPTYVPALGVLLPFVGCAFAVSFLLTMIGALIRNGQYTGVVEILYFIFVLVVGGAFAAACVGFLPRKKSLIAIFGVAGIGIVCAFVPLIMGDTDILSVLMRYIPSCVVLAAFGALALGLDNGEDANGRQG